MAVTFLWVEFHISGGGILIAAAFLVIEIFSVLWLLQCCNNIMYSHRMCYVIYLHLASTIKPSLIPVPSFCCFQWWPSYQQLLTQVNTCKHLEHGATAHTGAHIPEHGATPGNSLLRRTHTKDILTTYTQEQDTWGW